MKLFKNVGYDLPLVGICECVDDDSLDLWLDIAGSNCKNDYYYGTDEQIEESFNKACKIATEYEHNEAKEAEKEATLLNKHLHFFRFLVVEGLTCGGYSFAIVENPMYVKPDNANDELLDMIAQFELDLIKYYLLSKVGDGLNGEQWKLWIEDTVDGVTSHKQAFVTIR